MGYFVLGFLAGFCACVARIEGQKARALRRERKARKLFDEITCMRHCEDCDQWYACPWE